MHIRNGSLRIIVPDHARLRTQQRGLALTERVIAGMEALRRRADVGNREPLALLSDEGQRLVFEFRRDKSRAVVATVLGPEQQPQSGTRQFALDALVA